MKGCNAYFTICVECFEIHITYRTTFVNLLMAVLLKIVKFHFSNKKHQHIKNKNMYYENNFSIVIAFNFIFAHKTLMGTSTKDCLLVYYKQLFIEETFTFLCSKIWFLLTKFLNCTNTKYVVIVSTNLRIF